VLAPKESKRIPDADTLPMENKKEKAVKCFLFFISDYTGWPDKS